MGQHFIAREPFRFSNGATGYRPGGPFDCIGPYAKVINCPVVGLATRYTCYATGPADTAFSIPANTRIRGHYIRGFFTEKDGNIMFNPMDSEKEKIERFHKAEQSEIRRRIAKIANPLRAWTGGSQPSPLSQVSPAERQLIRLMFREQLGDWQHYWRGGIIRSTLDPNPTVLSVARLFWLRARHDAHATFRGHHG